MTLISSDAPHHSALSGNSLRKPVTDSVTVDEEREIVSATLAEWVRWALPLQRLDGSDQDGGFEDGNTGGWCDGRETAYRSARLIEAACHPEIDLDRDALHESIRRAIRFVLRRQSATGQLDLVGGYSPNEAGFPVPGLAMAYRHLKIAQPELFAQVASDLKSFMIRAAQAVLDGSALTANHRWAAACAPLAAVHALWPDERYLAKIEQYLADGIDCDEDGFWYEERSPNYNMVADGGLIAMADNLGRPELLEPVLRNFEFLLHMSQPNGEVDTTFSHRQDRAAAGRSVCNYLIARRVALLSGDGRITSLALDALRREQVNVRSMGLALFALDDHPQPMPPPEPLPTEYERVFKKRGIARIRRGSTSLTLASDPGGHFFDTVRDQWAGVRLSEDWFHLQHGDIVVQSLQLAPCGMYAIQPRHLAQEGSGSYRLGGAVDAWTHTLHFRPGSPKIPMHLDLKHQEMVRWHERTVDVRIDCVAPRALIASLNIWLRPGVEVDDGGQKHFVEAGEIITLQGGGPLVIRSETHTLTLNGLPEAQHRMQFLPGQAIPSSMPKTCGALCLGLRMPAALDLHWSC